MGSGLWARENTDELCGFLIEGLGGLSNIITTECCATRLRVELKDKSLIDEELLKKTGSYGVLHRTGEVQVIYGPHVYTIKEQLDAYIRSGRYEKAEPSGTHSESIEAKEKGFVISSPVSGRVVRLEDVEDAVFSQRLIGDGIAIEPENGNIYAPFDGRVEQVFESRHAISLVSAGGCELLIHVGINTVMLEGRYSKNHVSKGQSIKKGQLLMSFDLGSIKHEGYSTVTPVIICNSEDYKSISVRGALSVRAGEDLISVN